MRFDKKNNKYNIWFLSGETYDIEVKNKLCKTKYFHSRVPVEHVLLLEGNSNLFVRRLKKSYTIPSIFGQDKIIYNRRR